LFFLSPGTLRRKDWMRNLIRPRDFIALLGGAASPPKPLAARTQEGGLMRPLRQYAKSYPQLRQSVI
jgi:hypothetical protein